MENEKTITVFHTQSNAQDAIVAATGLPKEAIRSNGGKGQWKAFAAERGIELDKEAKNYDRDAVKALRAEFNVLMAEYHAKVGPTAAYLLALEGYRVNSLQPKYNKAGEYQGCNIAVRREPKSAGLTLRGENALLRKQLAEMQTKLAALPA